MITLIGGVAFDQGIGGDIGTRDNSWILRVEVSFKDKGDWLAASF